MKKHLLLFSILFFAFQIFAQQRVDGNFAFQTDPAKKYSIYIPSDYDANTPHTLMLGLHPLNTNRWDGKSWCDTLIAFAEMNNLLLVCPDGGIDGAIDDPIDTAFTTALLDSMEVWYNINLEKVYAMGFSWGGKTVYTYGLNHHERFRGFMPIGAAVSIGEVAGIEPNAAWHPMYLVHGGNDSPNTRFTPLKNAMENNDACVNSILMSGVGHTIDFPNRNQILTDAFQWVDSVACLKTTGTSSLVENENLLLFPNPVSHDQILQVKIPASWFGKITMEAINMEGKSIRQKAFKKSSNEVSTFSFPISKCPAGSYFLLVKNDKGENVSLKFQVK
jgi:predicted esterase